jgi:hypothetical protein
MYGFGVQCVFPVEEPVLAHNYFEGFNTGVYSQGGIYIKQIGNDYGANTNHWTWVNTHLFSGVPRIWNQSFGETFAGGGNINYPQDNQGLCQVLSGGTYYLDNATMAVGLGYVEHQRGFNMGDRQDVTFAAGNFTANGSMTWTVSGGNVTTFSWSIIGHTLTVWWDIAGSTIGGSLNTTLQILIPNGYVASKAVGTTCLVTNNGTNATGFASVGASGTVIQIIPSPTGGNWSASSANAGTEGTLTFPIN